MACCLLSAKPLHAGIKVRNPETYDHETIFTIFCLKCENSTQYVQQTWEWIVMKKNWKCFAGGTPGKNWKWKDPFGTLWCILETKKNNGNQLKNWKLSCLVQISGFSIPSNIRKSGKILKTLTPTGIIIKRHWLVWSSVVINKAPFSQESELN